MKSCIGSLVLLPVLFLCICATARAAERAGVVVGLQGKAAAVAADGSERQLISAQPYWLVKHSARKPARVFR